MATKSMILWGMDLGVTKISVKCRIRDVKYVGTMNGFDGYSHRWTASWKKSCNAQWRSMLLPRVWLSDCVIPRSTRFPCWVWLVLYVFPTATTNADNHAFKCTRAGSYNAITSKLLEVGSVCALGPDLVGVHSISLGARYGVAACSSTLSKCLEKVENRWSWQESRSADL